MHNVPLPFPPCRNLLRKKKNKRYKERWTVGNVHAVSDQQSDALAKSRSWYVHVYVSKTNEKL